MRTDRGWKRFYAAGWLVSGLVAVAATYQWRARMTALEEQLAEAQRVREEVLRRRVAEEQLRIARELHDSLTHSISVVTMQAGVAAHLARKRGEDVPVALSAIQEAAGDASRDLRETLSVLRRDDHANGYGLEDLPRLVARSSHAGIEPRLRISGRRRTVPAEVDSAAYRIIQEALTNVARHAGAAEARVVVEYGLDVVTVRVDDDGRTDPSAVPARPGLGLIGMRERTNALGGHLSAGRRPDGGFSVVAELPLTRDSGAAS
ncbi:MULTISPECIES: sensor histidine kinase [Mumia]|uniref:sensor histidine kinase n=1 Tax=Mumia TaxID=1546255 RepID=UPI001AB05796|nr:MULTISPECIES: histidine kinase [unclassified Mumia]